MLTGLQPDTEYQIIGQYQLLENNVWSDSSDMVPLRTLNVEQQQFEWNPQQKHSDFDLSEDNRVMQHTNDNGYYYRAVVSKSTLSATKWSSAKWEVTFQVCGTAHENLSLGFV